VGVVTFAYVYEAFSLESPPPPPPPPLRPPPPGPPFCAAPANVYVAPQPVIAAGAPLALSSAQLDMPPWYSLEAQLVPLGP